MLRYARTYSRKRAFQGKLLEGAENLCRLCLCEPEEIVPIFTDASELSISLATRITLCVGLEMAQEDCLPNQICIECHTELDRCYRFRKRCEASYQRLKAHLQAVKDKESKEHTKNSIRKSLILDSVKRECDYVNSLNNKHVRVAKTEDNSLKESGGGRRSEREKRDSNSEEQIIFVEIQGDGDGGTPRTANIWIDDVETKIEESVGAGGYNEINMNAKNPNYENVTSNLAENLKKNIVASDTCELKMLDEPKQQTIADPPARATPPPPPPPAPSLPDFLTSTLLALGALSRRRGELVLQPGLQELHLTMGEGTQLVLELEEEEEHLVLGPYENKEELQLSDKLKGTESGVKTPAGRPDAGSRRCGHCARVFTTPRSRARHERDVHARARPHLCGLCGRTFSQRSVMTRHQLTHQEKRPFACPSCPKSFTQRGALASHAMRHATAAERKARKRYLCPYSGCRKVFLYASGLSRHVKWHEGRKYMCDECGRVFSDKSALRRHLRSDKHRKVQRAKETS